VQLRLKVRRCPKQECERFAQPIDEREPLGIAPTGWLRCHCWSELYAGNIVVPQIHEMLQQRGVHCRTQCGTLLDRYDDELVTLYLNTDERWQEILKSQRQAMLPIDGMQPDVGHEVLWVIRECISGEILLAKTLLSSSAEDLHNCWQM